MTGPDVDVVHALVEDQFPRWADLEVVALRTSATVNVVYRLGDDLALRFPLQPTTREALEAEAAAAQAFSQVCPFAAPVPVAIGAPGRGVGGPWSVQTWVPGQDATVDDPGDSPQFALDLAELITTVQRVDTGGRTFAGEGRGGHLPDHDPWLAECFDRSEHLLDVPRLRGLWSELRDLPVVDADVMCHGDLTRPTCWSRTAGSSVFWTPVASVLPTRRSTSSRAGTCWATRRARWPERRCSAARPAGSEGGRGRSSRRWDSSGSTRPPTPSWPRGGAAPSTA